MKTLAHVSICLMFTCAIAVAQNNSAASTSGVLRSDSSTNDLGQTVICKSGPVPEGYIVTGEIFSDQCQGNAWLVKRRVPRNDGPNHFTAVADQPAAPAEVINSEKCQAFRQKVKATYNFRPALLSDAQVAVKSAELDKIWNEVRGSQEVLLPCLRVTLAESSPDSFFKIDGSMLLVELDPSSDAKATQVKEFTKANLDGIDLKYWVSTMARRGLEGFDVSEAGAKWLSYQKGKFIIPIHGNYEMRNAEAAYSIFGSMDEDMATPTLFRIANQPGHPGRESALWILMSQATPASLRALKQLNLSGLSSDAQRGVQSLLEGRQLLKPRANPITTREENVIAFQRIVEGDWTPFYQLVEKAPDGEVDAVAVLKDEDLQVLRRARRAAIARVNPHMFGYYQSFTMILMARTWKPDLVN